LTCQHQAELGGGLPVLRTQPVIVFGLGAHGRRTNALGGAALDAPAQLGGLSAALGRAFDFLKMPQGRERGASRPARPLEFRVQARRECTPPLESLGELPDVVVRFPTGRRSRSRLSGASRKSVSGRARLKLSAIKIRLVLRPLCAWGTTGSRPRALIGGDWLASSAHHRAAFA
jgi:hypothetical protein